MGLWGHFNSNHHRIFACSSYACSACGGQEMSEPLQLNACGFQCRCWESNVGLCKSSKCPYLLSNLSCLFFSVCVSVWCVNVYVACVIYMCACVYVCVCMYSMCVCVWEHARAHEWAHTCMSSSQHLQPAKLAGKSSCTVTEKLVWCQCVGVVWHFSTSFPQTGKKIGGEGEGKKLNLILYCGEKNPCQTFKIPTRVFVEV